MVWDISDVWKRRMGVSLIIELLMTDVFASVILYNVYDFKIYHKKSLWNYV